MIHFCRFFKQFLFWQSKPCQRGSTAAYVHGSWGKWQFVAKILGQVWAGKSYWAAAIINRGYDLCVIRDPDK